VIDFASLAREAAQKKAVTSPTVRETVRTTPVAGAAYLLKADQDWTAEDLRDYVMGQIEAHHGPQVRNSVREMATFKAFLARWEAKAPAIARFAFEVQRGMWQRAPISVNRFCKASDPYFAALIAERV
jgi:hypothetical protein